MMDVPSDETGYLLTKRIDDREEKIKLG